jgi:hypothetical protein
VKGGTGAASRWVYVYALEYSVALGVGDVVLNPEVAEGVEPALGADDGAILEPLLLAVLAVEGLKAKVPLRALVRLYVILRLRIHVPAAPLGLDLVCRQAEDRHLCSTTDKGHK